MKIVALVILVDFFLAMAAAHTLKEEWEAWKKVRVSHLSFAVHILFKLLL